MDRKYLCWKQVFLEVIKEKLVITDLGECNQNALKGQNIPAQAEGLGYGLSIHKSPERARYIFYNSCGL